MKSSFHPEAREEFLAAIDAYKEIDPQLGVDFASEVYAGVELIEAFPLAWTEVSFKIRRCLLRRFPYALLYSVEKEELVIYAVMHTHREPGYWKHRM